jgi:DNA-binding response OmpR family regulator
VVNVLVIEDDINLCETVKLYIEREGLTCFTAKSASSGMDLMRRCRPELIVLDVMLPDEDGFEICRQIREMGSFMPILILTARNAEEDRIRGLSAGADDYLAKPFSARELVARIKSLLRRAYAVGYRDAVPSGGVTVDVSKRQAFLNGETLDLRGKEFDLLSQLVAAPGRTYSREDLLERLWSYDFEGDVRIVDVYIRKLREKIEQDPAHPQYIQTVWGVGYRFKADEQ